MDPTSSDVHVPALMGTQGYQKKPRKPRRKKPMPETTEKHLGEVHDQRPHGNRVPTWMQQFTDGTGAIVIPNYVSVVGDAVKNLQHGTVDVIVRESERPVDAWRGHLSDTLTKVFEIQGERKLRMAYNEGGPQGSGLEYVPVFDLVLSPSDGRRRLVKAREREIAKRGSTIGRWFRLLTTGTASASNSGSDVNLAAQTEPIEKMKYHITKSDDVKRYTLGPVYMPKQGVDDPNWTDAHGEWTDASNLQNAAWDFVKASTKSERQINFQHMDVRAGEWVEIVNWPYEVSTELLLPDGKGGMEKREVVMPPGTEYMGVIWDEPAWELVQQGKLRGFSMGGWARRMSADFAQ